MTIVCVGISFAKNMFTVHGISEKRCSAAHAGAVPCALIAPSSSSRTYEQQTRQDAAIKRTQSPRELV